MAAIIFVNFTELFRIATSQNNSGSVFLIFIANTKNISSLIGREEYNIGRICTLFSIFALCY